MITLATLSDATPQQVFDQVARHLLRQKAKSVESETTNLCRYRGVKGRQCAAGCLIGDDEYKDHFEGEGWDLLVGECLVPRDHSALIDELQDAHDSNPVEEWPDQLRIIAHEYRLNESVIDQETAA